jgi:sugar/nucleoside kinase (ribokinase family)
MKKPVVTIIGHVCVDHNTIDGVSRTTWGSSAMYIAKYYLKNFDVRPRIVARYGHDFTPFAHDFVFTEQPEGEVSLRYENIVNNGERVQFCHRSEASGPVPLREDIAELVRGSDIVIVAPLLDNYSADYIARVMQYASEDCLKVLLPQGFVRHINAEEKIEKQPFADASAIVSYFDLVVASEEDGDDMMTQAQAWFTAGAGNVVITQAEKGATVFNPRGNEQIPTTPLSFYDIKNPVGSGDMFSAQLAIGMHDGLDAHEATRRANQTMTVVLLGDPLE